MSDYFSRSYLSSDCLISPSRDSSISACSLVLHSHILSTAQGDPAKFVLSHASPAPANVSISQPRFVASSPSPASHFLPSSSHLYSMSPAAEVAVSISPHPTAAGNSSHSHSHSHSHSTDASSPDSDAYISSHHFQLSFDIDNFLPKSYVVRVPIVSTAASFTTFMQTPKENYLPIPSVSHIFRFIKRVFDRTVLNGECVIISLIYIERLLSAAKIRLSHRNWLPIVTAALLAASKVWDDHSALNGEFASIIPIFSLQHLNSLERLFLATIAYDLYISPSEFARYYFGLRAFRAAKGKELGQSSGSKPSKYYLALGLALGAPTQAKKDLMAENEEEIERERERERREYEAAHEFDERKGERDLEAGR